jgi:DNA-binding transcriptional LysR family regulator
MELSKLDLNLLLVFAAVMRRRSATLAGEDLDMTQSAISNALRRLRLHLSDPLFIKTPQGMSPTPLAERMAQPLQEALDAVRQALEAAREFDPATSRRAFRVAVSDVGQLILMPRLARKLEHEAPEVSVAVVNVEPRAAHAFMAEGTVDIAIGTFESMQAGFHSQRLFTKSYCVLGRAGHPALQGGLSLEAFLAARHAVYHPPANSHDDFEQVVAGVFRAHGAERRVAMELAHGLGIREVVAATDLLVCVPRRLADSCVACGDVESATLPFESPAVDVSQFWHHRFHADAAHKWLRSLVFRHYAPT